MTKLTQQDYVTEEMGFIPEIITERVALPGIKTLHEKPTDEIATALAMVLKSRANVVAVKYQVGEFIELTLKQ